MSVHTGRANDGSAKRASSGNVCSNSQRSSGRSRPVPSCGHCGAWTWRSTSPGISTLPGGVATRAAPDRSSAPPASLPEASTAVISPSSSTATTASSSTCR